MVQKRACACSMATPVRVRFLPISPQAILGLKPSGKTADSNSKSTKHIMKKFIFTLASVSLSFLVSAQTLINYQATVNSQSPNFYFTFDGGSLTDSTGH